MKHLKIYEEFNVSMIENIEKIKDEKFYKILEYYASIADIDKDKVELNIPVDIYFTYSGGVGGSYLSKEKTEGDCRHFYMIKSMWMGLKRQYFRKFNEAPYFIITLLSEEPRQEVGGRDMIYHEHVIIRQNKPKKNLTIEQSYDSVVIDILYDYVMDHQEIVSAKKYNL